MNIWIIQFHHKHGMDVWPLLQEAEPLAKDIEKECREEGVWEKDEENEIEVTGPWKLEIKHY